MKNVRRREFLAQSAAAACAAGLAGCDTRKATGPDLRRPSPPAGLTAAFREGAVALSWQPHALTDYLGTRSETGVQFNIFKDNARMTSPPIDGISFSDPDVNIGVRYEYKITAVDREGNESDPSYPAYVKPGSEKLIGAYRSEAVLSGSVFNASAIKSLLHQGITRYTGIAEVGRAFASFFPGLTAAKTIAVKINTLAGAMLSTHPQVVDALADGLTQMLDNTFPAYNIIVFDDRDTAKITQAGFIVRDTAGLYRCATTRDDWGTARTISGTVQRLSGIAERADYIINVPVLKDHTEAGITFSLKNLYGAVDHPENMHGNSCDPMIAEVYALFSGKVRLIIGDALVGAHSGGPSTYPNINPPPKSLYIGTDPVAMDLYALWRINEARKALNRPVILASPDGAARHISTAGSSPHLLGDISFTPSADMEVTL